MCMEELLQNPALVCHPPCTLTRLSRSSSNELSTPQQPWGSTFICAHQFQLISGQTLQLHPI